MLETALQGVKHRGLTVGFEHLQMEQLIQDADVPRSSVYRLWATKDAFIEELLREVAAYSSRHLMDEGTLQLCVEVVANNLSLLRDRQSREWLALEVIRTALEHNYYVVIDSLQWQSFVSISATLLGQPSQNKTRGVEHSISDGSAKFIAEMADFYRWLSSVLGYRLKDRYAGNYELFAVLCSAMVEGLGVRHLSNPAITDNFFEGPNTTDNGSEQWSPASLGLVALYREFFEPDPDFQFNEALRNLAIYQLPRTTNAIDDSDERWK